MKLVRYNPARNLISLPYEIDRFFDDFGLGLKNTDSVWNPSVDLSETDDHYEVKAEIPGMKKEEIKISVKDNVLTLSGEKKQEIKKDDEKAYRIERMYGQFERSFTLPKNVEADAIKAKYKDGVLTVQIPKTEEVKPKEIVVN